MITTEWRLSNGSGPGTWKFMIAIDHRRPCRFHRYNHPWGRGFDLVFFWFYMSFNFNRGYQNG